MTASTCAVMRSARRSTGRSVKWPKVAIIVLHMSDATHAAPLHCMHLYVISGRPPIASHRNNE